VTNDSAMNGQSGILRPLPCASAHGGGLGRGRTRGTATASATAPILSFPRRRGKGRLIAALTLMTLALSACGNIEPWVKPYERQALADPIMALDANPVSTAYLNHVYEAREGARGGLGSAGGGCGCN
jgi:hypothetical protein